MGLFTAFKAFFWALGNGKEATKLLAEAKQPASDRTPKKPDSSHLRLLGLLQQSGRLVDFLKEDIGTYSDAQIGAAVRQVHEACGKSLEDLLTIRPVLEDEEGGSMTVPEGYDPSEIRLLGKVQGKGPYQGKLVHRGWRVHKQSLPTQVGEQNTEILFPAEVEVS